MIPKNKKPLKSKKVKVIDYLGTYYATINGSSLWEMDKAAFAIWKLCDGKKTFEELVEIVSKKSGIKAEELKPLVKKILEELTELGFIEWI